MTTEFIKEKDRLFYGVWFSGEDRNTRTIEDQLILYANEIEDALHRSDLKTKDYSPTQVMGWAVQMQSAYIIAQAIRELGMKDASTPMGAIEMLALEVKNGLGSIADVLETTE